jgi:hypothetical protein
MNDQADRAIDDHAAALLFTKYCPKKRHFRVNERLVFYVRAT